MLLMIKFVSPDGVLLIRVQSVDHKCNNCFSTIFEVKNSPNLNKDSKNLHEISFFFYF